MQTPALLPKSLVLRPVNSALFLNHRFKSPSATRDRRFQIVRAVTKEEEETPPWARKEKERELAALEKDLPFGVYLLGSALVAIAATGSWFELANKNPIFGVLGPSNPLWSIILGFFGVSGYPTAGYLFYRSVQSANKASERSDRADGY